MNIDKNRSFSLLVLCIFLTRPNEIFLKISTDDINLKCIFV